MTQNIEDFVNASKAKPVFGSVKVNILSVGSKNTRKDWFIEEYVVGDHTGSINLVLFDHPNQYKVGDSLSINQCYSKMYKNQNQLAVGRKGTITANGQSIQQMANKTPKQTTMVIPAKKPKLTKNAIVEQIIAATELDASEIDTKIASKMDEFKILGNVLDENAVAEMVAKLEGVELTYPKAPLIDTEGNVMREKPLVDLTEDELRDAFKSTQKGSARGLIDKELMARREGAQLERMIAAIHLLASNFETIDDEEEEPEPEPEPKPKKKKKTTKKKTSA